MIAAQTLTIRIHQDEHGATHGVWNHPELGDVGGFQHGRIADGSYTFAGFLRHDLPKNAEGETIRAIVLRQIDRIGRELLEGHQVNSVYIKPDARRNMPQMHEHVRGRQMSRLEAVAKTQRGDPTRN